MIAWRNWLTRHNQNGMRVAAPSNAVETDGSHNPPA